MFDSLENIGESLLGHPCVLKKFLLSSEKQWFSPRCSLLQLISCITGFFLLSFVWILSSNMNSPQMMSLTSWLNTGWITADIIQCPCPSLCRSGVTRVLFCNLPVRVSAGSQRVGNLLSLCTHPNVGKGCRWFWFNNSIVSFNFYCWSWRAIKTQDLILCIMYIHN